MRYALLLPLAGLAACSSNPATPAASPDPSTVRVVGTQGALVTQIATTNTSRPRVVTLDIPLADVWRHLPGAYETVGIALTHRDASAGVLGNEGFRARRRLKDTRLSLFVDCGNTQGVPSADTYEVHFSVLTEVRKDGDDKTLVVTNVDATAKPVNFAGDPVRCLSKGELENRILNVVRAAATP